MQDTVVNTFETIKQETINLFNGTTFKKIFFLSNDGDEKSDSSEESVISLSKHIEDLKRTIESSKVYMRAIIEKIRYQGKIKLLTNLTGIHVILDIKVHFLIFLMLHLNLIIEIIFILLKD